MTVRNGCTAAEARAANKKLMELAARQAKETDQRKKERDKAREERWLRRARELGVAARVLTKRWRGS
jgi:hypothetical protein